MRSRHFLLVGERMCQVALPMLEPLGKLELTTTAADAVRILDEHRFSLTGFFADIDLPDGTAFDVLERAWFLEIYVPGLVATAHAGPYPNQEVEAKEFPRLRRDADGAMYWEAAFLAHPFAVENVRIQVERWDQCAADDHAEDELFVQRLAREREVDPAEIRGHVEGTVARGGRAARSSGGDRASPPRRGRARGGGEALTGRGTRSAIAALLEAIGSDPKDMRSRLKLGDLYASAGEVPNALQMYEEVARFYAHQGFVLKAVAVYKQICAMVVRDAPHLRPRYAHVPPILAELYQHLGLSNEAVAALDALGQDPGGGQGLS